MRVVHEKLHLLWRENDDTLAACGECGTEFSHMHASISLPRRTLTVWLAAFFSPVIYFLLLLFGDTFHFPSLPDIIVACLVYFIPPVALLICGFEVWMSNMTVAAKIGWMFRTLVGMLLQFGVLLAIFVVAS